MLKNLGSATIDLDENADAGLRPTDTSTKVPKVEPDLMVLPEDEQLAFEAKMDQFLLQENLPKVLTEHEASA